MKKKKLVLLTNDYPYGIEEKSFIEPELPFLLNKFDLKIVSTSKSNQITSKLNKNIEVYHFCISFTRLEKIFYILKYLTNIYCIREIYDIVYSKEKVLERIRDSIGFYGSAEKLYRKMLKSGILNKKQENYIYSYWCHINCLAIVLHKNKFPEMKIITRLHGYDLYQDRNTFGRQPFRFLIHKRINKMIFAAQEARDYYEQKWKDLNPELCEVHKLGIINRYDLTEYKRRNEFNLVSCSHLIELKRIDLIINALSKINNICIKWVHFGDGKDSEFIKNLAHKQLDAKTNIIYDFKGFVKNDIIMKYYNEQTVDCFITTSSTEGGCPVSIQEAISFGIPVIGTKVGGIPSMIKGNGILLSKNTNIDEVTNAIKEIWQKSDEDLINMRNNSRTIWEKEFNAQLNNEKFIESIYKIFNT